MGVTEIRRLKQLEGENAKLKPLLADAMLDTVALKGLLGSMYGSPRRCKTLRHRSWSNLRWPAVDRA